MQDIEGQIANFGATKGKRIQAAQKKVAAAKTTLEKAKAAAKTAAQAHLQAVAEGEAAAGERKSLAAQLQVAQQTIEGARRYDMRRVEQASARHALPGKLCSGMTTSACMLEMPCRNAQSYPSKACLPAELCA